MVRRAAAEFVGTAFLVAAVIGSGIAASRLSPGQIGLELLEISLATGFVLFALIVALQRGSAAFTRLVTVAERAFGTITTPDAAALIGVQLAGGIVGAIVANAMFDLDAVTIATQHRSGGGLWLGEAVATLGLLVVIFGAVRTGRANTVAGAVGTYIAAAIWFTSSTSFANPAVTIARMFSNTITGIAPASVPMFVVMQLVGGVVAFGLIALLYPDSAARAAEMVDAEPHGVHVVPTTANALPTSRS